MLAQVFGSTTNNTTTNNTFLQSLVNFLNNLYQSAFSNTTSVLATIPTNIPAQSPVEITREQDTYTVLVNETEAIVGAVLVPLITISALGTGIPAVDAFIPIMLAQGVTQQMLSVYQNSYYNKIDPGTGFSYTAEDAVVALLTGWTLLQVSSMNGFLTAANNQNITSGTFLGSKKFSVTCRNTSAGGQIIRIGVNPSFGPNAGIPLNPGDFYFFDNFNLPISAIANGAGGLLSLIIKRTT
jgi:hypothetical protein